jgi:hypothetical protein
MPHADVDGQRIFFEDTGGGLRGSGPVVAVRGGHAANLTNREPVNAAIREFLAGLPD